MGNYFLYCIGQFLALVFPLRVAYAVAVFFSDVHYLFANVDRRNVYDNLKAIFPAKSHRELAAIRLRMFRNFAKYLVDFFRFSRIDRRYMSRYVTVENRHFLDQALAKGKGVIALTAHLGNWELGGAVMGMLGYPVVVVALTHKDKAVNRFFDSQRNSKGVQVVPLGKAVRQCLKACNDNKVIGLVGDRDFTTAGRVYSFFGQPALFPEGPAVLAVQTSATIIPGFMLRNNDDTFTLRFEPPVRCALTGNRQADVDDIIHTYLRIFEDYIRRYPDQWYMFRHFWIEETK